MPRPFVRRVQGFARALSRPLGDVRRRRGGRRLCEPRKPLGRGPVGGVALSAAGGLFRRETR